LTLPPEDPQALVAGTLKIPQETAQSQ